MDERSKNQSLVFGYNKARTFLLFSHALFYASLEREKQRASELASC